MGVFPEWVTSSKVGSFLNENPCPVSSKSSELFLNKTDLTLKSRFFGISSCCYDVIMRAKPHSNYQYWRRTVNEQNQGTILHGRQSLLKISGQNLKNRYFEHVYVCDVTWWCHNSKTKKIWNQPAKSFHMRYHTTLSDFRIKFCRFSDHYDVTMRVFPEWVTSSKVGPFLNKDPC